MVGHNANDKSRHFPQINISNAQKAEHGYVFYFDKKTDLGVLIKKQNPIDDGNKQLKYLIATAREMSYFKENLKLGDGLVLKVTFNIKHPNRT